MMLGARKGLGSAAAVSILLVVALAVVAEAYVTTSQSNSDQLGSQSSLINGLQSQVQSLASRASTGGTGGNVSLPVMNQQPTIRTITETWYISPSAHQDRFSPAFIVVNQGDTVKLTLIDNDTVAHDFVIGPPYNIIVNATVPGLINDLTGQTFTTASRNNSPGVVVQGTPGNVSASYTFVAVHSGIFEFVCTYHAQVGMIGYLVVLPNAAFESSTGTTTTTTSASSVKPVAVSIVQGAGIPYSGYTQGSATLYGYDPLNMTVVIGVNNTVTWTNNDGTIHTVSANDGSFDSGYLNPGQSFTYTFTKPGVYEYHCQLHPWMLGYVTVVSG